MFSVLAFVIVSSVRNLGHVVSDSAWSEMTRMPESLNRSESNLDRFRLGADSAESWTLRVETDPGSTRICSMTWASELSRTTPSRIRLSAEIANTDKNNLDPTIVCVHSVDLALMLGGSSVNVGG